MTELQANRFICLLTQGQQLIHVTLKLLPHFVAFFVPTSHSRACTVSFVLNWGTEAQLLPNLGSLRKECLVLDPGQTLRDTVSMLLPRCVQTLLLRPAFKGEWRATRVC